MRCLATLLVLLFTVVGCGRAADPPPSAAGGVGDAGYPLTVQNCGRDVIVETPPRRAVSLNQSSTEILLSLGLADRMAGTATWTDPVRANLAAANETVPRLAENKPSLETVLGADPDLVTASFVGTLGSGGVAEREQFHQLGVPTYLAPSDCEGKVANSADGARTQPLTMDLIYREITDLATIFDVPRSGEDLVAGLQRRLDAVNPADSGVTAAFWFSDIRTPYMAGCCGSPGIIAAETGLRNVFDDTQDEWPQVSWETVADRDPDVLVLADLSRRTIDGDALDSKIEFLESNPVTRQLSAVRENRYIVVNGADLNPSIRTVDGVEKVADGLSEFGLASPR